MGSAHFSLARGATYLVPSFRKASGWVLCVGGTVVLWRAEVRGSNPGGFSVEHLLLSHEGLVMKLTHASWLWRYPSGGGKRDRKATATETRYVVPLARRQYGVFFADARGHAGTQQASRHAGGTDGQAQSWGA